MKQINITLLTGTLKNVSLIGVFMLGMFATNTIAQEQLRLVTEIYPPYQIKEEGSSRIKGMRVDTIREILALTDLSYDIKVMPWARSYKAALNTPNTCIFSAMRLPFRENDFHWVIPLGDTSSVVYVVKDRINEYHIKKLSDLQHYITVVHREDAVEQLLRRLGYQEGKHLFVVSGWKQAIDLAIKRRADIIVGNDLIIAYYMQLANVSPDYLVPIFPIPQLKKMQHYLACNKNTSPEIIEKIQNAYDSAKSSGLIDDVIKNWREKLNMINQRGKSNVKPAASDTD